MHSGSTGVGATDGASAVAAAGVAVSVVAGAEGETMSRMTVTSVVSIGGFLQ
jgi:hypothetical protein